MCTGLPYWLGTLIWVPWMGAAPQVTFCSPVTEFWSEPSPGDSRVDMERLISHYGSTISRPITHRWQAPVRHCHPPRAPVHHTKSFLPSPPL